MSKPNQFNPKELPLQTRAQLEQLVQEITALRLRFQETATAMDQAVLQARQAYAANLETLQAAMTAQSARAQAWAEGHPEEFGGLKRLELASGAIGWRLGQPQIKTVRGWTWDRVLEKLRNLDPFAPFIRRREEVNKAKLLGERERLGAQQLRELGLQVVQEETFYIEPKLNRAPERVSQPV